MKSFSMILVLVFISGCTSMPKVVGSNSKDSSFLYEQNIEGIYALFSVDGDGNLFFEKDLQSQPASSYLSRLYAENIKISKSTEIENGRNYYDCVVLKRNESHSPCLPNPEKGSLLTSNRLTGAGLVAGAIFAPFIIFEATLQTLTGDTKGAKDKIGQFDATTEPAFNKSSIKKIGNTLLDQISKDYKVAKSIGQIETFLVKLTRTQKEAIRRSKAIDTSKAQSFLSYLGLYKGRVDGKAGKMTKAALKTYQANNNLVTSGALDQETKVAMVDTMSSSEFEYHLAKKNDTISGYEKFLRLNPRSKNISEAKARMIVLEEIAKEKQAEKNRRTAERVAKEALAANERRRKRLASLRNEIYREQNNAELYRGRTAYMCIKVNVFQRVLEWGLGNKWDTCDVTINEVSRDKVNVTLQDYSCGMGWSREDGDRWVNKGQLFFRSNCDKWMHALE